MNTKPSPLTPNEWNEVVALDVVREAWGLQPDETGEGFSGTVYGVKFDFVSGSPGYVGDLYVLQGDALSGPPLVLVRDGQRHLVPVTFDG